MEYGTNTRKFGWKRAMVANFDAVSVAHLESTQQGVEDQHERN